jgi:hypothetical protein
MSKHHAAWLVSHHPSCALQTGDEQVVAQFALNAFAASTDVGDRLLTQAWDQKARAHARTVCRMWAAKGYQVVYLSGRQVCSTLLVLVKNACKQCGGGR